MTHPGGSGEIAPSEIRTWGRTTASCIGPVSYDLKHSARYAPNVAERPLLHRIHNPSNYECGCDPDCWCRRTRIGRLVKWWFPARYFGIRHKNHVFDGMTRGQIRQWKREQQRR
jgi:hypothetical protein